MNSNQNIDTFNYILNLIFPNFLGYLEEEKFNEAIEFINNNTNNFLNNNFISLLYDKISKQIDQSLKNGNYEDCHNKINLLQKINNKPNDLEALILNKDGCIYFRENNYNKAYTFFMEALKKSSETNEIFAKNLFNSFVGLLPTLAENKNYQEIYDRSVEIQKAPNTKFCITDKIIIEYSEFKSSKYLNFSDTERLANKLIEEIKGENFEEKKIINSEICLYFYEKKNINKAYEIINLVEPNKEPLYLQLKIILSAHKIEELLNNKKNVETENIYESIKKLDINVLNVEKWLEIYNYLKKIISNIENSFTEKKIEQYIEKNQFEEALSQCDILLEKDKKYQEFKSEIIKKQKNYLFSQQKEGKINIKNYINKLNLNTNDTSKKNNAISLICEIMNEDLIDNNIDETKNICEKALEKNPKDINLINTKALIDMKEGDIISAKKNIDNALEQDPNNNFLKNNKLEIIGKIEEYQIKILIF